MALSFVLTLIGGGIPRCLQPLRSIRSFRADLVALEVPQSRAFRFGRAVLSCRVFPLVPRPAFRVVLKPENISFNLKYKYR